MTKIGSLRKYASDSNRPMRVWLSVIWIIQQLPGLYIHEGSHLLAIFVTRCGYTFGKWKLLNVESNKSVQYLIGYECPVMLDGTAPSWKHLVVASAPVLGILLCLGIGTYIAMNGFVILGILMYVYLLFNMNAFFLSDADISTTRNSLKLITQQYKKQ